MISIIIPIYNVDKYLRTCLDSVLEQTYQDFEVLLIDDGSTDNSSNICDAYSQQDNRFKSFHFPNRGVSKARNIGIEKAEGEWITFIDADDSIKKDYLYILHQGVSENNVDHAIGYYSNIKRGVDCTKYLEPKQFCLSPKEVIYMNFKHKYFWPGYVFSKLFKTSILKQNNIYFDEKQYLIEDGLFCVNYLTYCTKPVFLTTEPLYNYTVIREGSAMNTCFAKYSPKALSDFYGHVKFLYLVDERKIKGYMLRFHIKRYIYIAYNRILSRLKQWQVEEPVNDIKETYNKVVHPLEDFLFSCIYFVKRKLSS